MLPASAPTSFELASSASPEASDFAYSNVKLDGRIVAILNRFHPTLASKFKGGRYVPTNALSPGDVVAVTVYETGGQTLFPPPAVVPGAASSTSPIGAVATGASNIPPQVIERDGTIFVPFAGRLSVAGLTPGQAGTAIARQLEGKAVSPQVLVSLVNNLGTAATVGGDVGSPKSVPLGSRGERLLDVIAAAGGSKFPAYESYVHVIRNGEAAHLLLQTVVSNPNENIFIRPRDQIYLVHNPRTFSVLGASQRVNAYPFGREKVTLAEAIAQGGGPIDAVGDPSGIYLFRFEPIGIAREILGPDLDIYGPSPPEFVPILYRIDMRDAQGYFLTQAVQMRDKDIVLVTNAESTQFRKVLAIVKGISGIAYDFARVDELGRR
jgi:polysaccharide export outer membrane protein